MEKHRDHDKQESIRKQAAASTRAEATRRSGSGNARDQTDNSQRPEHPDQSNDIRMGNTFVNMGMYQDLSPPVAEGLQLLTSLDEFDTFFDFVLDDLKTELAEILPTLANGYNLYHYDEKAAAYREVRTRVTRVQSRLFLLNELGILNNEPVVEICRDFESSIGRLNGLIRQMEESGGGGG